MSTLEETLISMILELGFGKVLYILSDILYRLKLTMERKNHYGKNLVKHDHLNIMIIIILIKLTSLLNRKLIGKVINQRDQENN